MFYSNNQIKSILICNLCKNVFSDPRIVSCGQTFCNKCIKPSENNYCGCICEEKRHEVPKKGFPVNLAIQNFLKQQPGQVSRGEKGDQLRLILSKIKIDIDDIEKSLDHSEDKIKEHCFSIRNAIDLKTETSIQNIQNQRDKLLKEVNLYEQECLANLKKVNKTKEKLDNSIKEIKSFYSAWQNSFEKHYINELEVTNALSFCETYLSKITINKLDLKRHIFNNKFISFMASDRDFGPIGSLQFKDLGISVDFSKLSSVSLKSIVSTLDGISTESTNMNFLNDDKIFVCHYINHKLKLHVYDLHRRRIDVSNQISLSNISHYSNPKYIKCTSLDKDIIIAVILDDQYNKTIYYKVNTDNASFNIIKLGTIDSVLIDIDMNSEYICMLAKTKDSYLERGEPIFYPACNDHEESYFSDPYLISREPNSNLRVKSYELKLYDHSLNAVRKLSIKNLNITREITNIRINDNYVFLFDPTPQVALINIKDDSCVRQFKLDGTIFSLYNEMYILSYNPTSKLITMYDYDGTIQHNQAIDSKLNPISLKGGKKRILLYDNRTDNIYF